MGVQVRGNTVKTTGATALRNHVLMQKDNDEVPRILYGDEGFFANAELASKLARHQNGFFHAQLTFSDLPRNADIKKLVSLWRKEYDPQHKHDLILIEHVKQRSDGKSSEKHYHICMSMTGNDGKSLSVKHSKVRNEKIARMTEIELGMSLTRGAHNRAVLQAFESDPSLSRYAEAMKASGITEGQRPRAAFESDDLQRAGRLGLPLKETVSAIKKMDQSAPDFHLNLVKYLKENGIAYQKGDKRHAVILTKDGQHIGSTLNRILGIKQSGTNDLLRQLDAASKSAGIQTGFDFGHFARARGASESGPGTERRPGSGKHSANANSSSRKHGQALAIHGKSAGSRLRSLRTRLKQGRAATGVSTIIPFVAEIRDNNPVIVDIESMDTGTLLKVINEANARNARRKPGLTF